MYLYIPRNDNESEDNYLYRVGEAKANGELNATWDEIAEVMVTEFGVSHDASYWRKKYNRLKKANDITSDITTETTISDSSISEDIRNNLIQLNEARIRIRDERASFNRAVRADARNQDTIEILKNEITKYSNVTDITLPPVEYKDKMMLAMLSDIHYGMNFNTPYGEYNADVANYRVMKYANHLISIAETNGIHSIHVALMGDMISGANHKSIRIENRENVVQQVIGVSELVSKFLYTLSHNFSKITVSSVSGNHSRIEEDFNNALRAERLDSLIPWYCKTKLSDVSNIEFIDNNIDPTISVIELLGKTYVAVHGDIDNDPHESATRLSDIVKNKIDYMLSGHMHIAETRFENIGLIRNGSVITGGDEYTAKKRLFGPAVQVCMICSDNGIDALYPIRLS